MFNTEDYFTEYTNITTKFKWKLFTKVNEQRGLGWIDRESN